MNSVGRTDKAIRRPLSTVLLWVVIFIVMSSCLYWYYLVYPSHIRSYCSKTTILSYSFEPFFSMFSEIDSLSEKVFVDTTECTYNEYGLLVDSCNGSNRACYEYDRDGRWIKRVFSGTIGCCNYRKLTHVRKFDDKGRVCSITETMNGSWTITKFEYDSLHHLSNKTHVNMSDSADESYSYRYKYDKYGHELEKTTYKNGVMFSEESTRYDSVLNIQINSHRWASDKNFSAYCYHRTYNGCRQPTREIKFLFQKDIPADSILCYFQNFVKNSYSTKQAGHYQFSLLADVRIVYDDKHRLFMKTENHPSGREILTRYEAGRILEKMESLQGRLQVLYRYFYH